MSLAAFILVSAAAIRWLDLPPLALLTACPLVAALATVGGLAAGVA